MGVLKIEIIPFQSDNVAVTQEMIDFINEWRVLVTDAVNHDLAEAFAKLESDNETPD